ncbi:DUF887-domain-containing protein [Patellaria atrata CBS 101060]|uniref:DUF887-domain-containing protein n=1 Tax=Patellaria atrata CBS 101060 TaxID=1346257 RepID=A0A9P4SD01_9PEZI|nr:DUF887-domain-containing protein [Patellaria atrata CBS 101060]
MLDPNPIANPSILVHLTEPIAEYLSLKTLHLHSHEVLFAAGMYHLICRFVSPFLSNLICPSIYSKLNPRTRINWDVHVVSFVQSTLISVMAFWIMLYDDDRSEMNWRGRVYGYTGSLGLLQAFAAGYFLWDFFISTYYVGIFGIGLWFHALSALSVYTLGFRPFLNFYGPTFILYELSSPFLNIHWFCDKLNLTGSKIQLYNGIILLTTFFFCRIIWGTYNSFHVFYDIWTASRHHGIDFDEKFPPGASADPIISPNNVGGSTMLRFHNSQMDVVPLWLAVAYLSANMTLHALNFFWFGKMIATIRKRFDPPLGTRAKVQKLPPTKNEDKVFVEGVDVETDDEVDLVTGKKTKGVEVEVMRGVDLDGRKTVEVEGTQVRSRRRG